MGRGSSVDQSQDQYSAARVTVGLTASSVVFAPADGPQTWNGYPTAVVSSVVTIKNYDATNSVWVRLQTFASGNVSQGIKFNGAPGLIGQGQVPVAIDTTTFTPATAASPCVYIGPGESITLYVRAVGVSLIAPSGAPVVNILVSGGLYNFV